MMREVYINKKTQAWIDKLIDLFCLEDAKPTIVLRPRRDNRTGYTSNFVGYESTNPKQNSIVQIGCKGGIRLTTLVHEMLHVAGFDHEYEINGYSNFRNIHCSITTEKIRDDYSPLIVKDLTGKKELIF